MVSSDIIVGRGIYSRLRQPHILQRPMFRPKILLVTNYVYY